MIQELISAGIIRPPHFVRTSIQLEVTTGSQSYGTAHEKSDQDIYAVCIPAKEFVFPTNEIIGFGTPKQKFDQYLEHHLKFKDKEFDVTIFSITKYFDKCMQCNPNMVDTLFVPVNCINHITKIGNLIRENRKLFLHKGYWHKSKGFAYSELNKIRTTDQIDRVESPKRREDILKHGYDTKRAANAVRLLNQAEQVLMEENLDLLRNREQFKSIRRGEWTLERIKEYFQKKESELETVYLESKLRLGPDEDSIKELLLKCLEEYYGSIDQYVVTESRALATLTKIKELVGEL